jgi:hypothetical protein
MRNVQVVFDLCQLAKIRLQDLVGFCAHLKQAEAIAA